MAQQLRLMVQLVEILVVVTLEAISSNLEGLFDLGTHLSTGSNYLLNIRAIKD